MRMWARNTSRAALVAAGAVAIGAAFGSGAAIADTTAPDGGPAAAGAWQAPAERAAAARYGGGGGDMKTSGTFSIGGGNQVFAPITLPIDVCGNSIAIVGLSRAQCKGGASVSSGGHGHHGYRTAEPAWGGGGWDGGGGHGGMETSGNFSILGGNQVYAPITAPVSVCGNSVAIVGISEAQCKGGASVERGGKPPKMRTSGNFSILGGNQVFAPITAPISVCGNSIAVIGISQAQCKGGAFVGDGGEELPPTLRTPPVKKKHKKPYKPSKHRPAAKHKKLPSTLRPANSRMAGPIPGSEGGDSLGPVKRAINTLKKFVPLPGVDVSPGEVGPKLPTDGEMPVRVGTPVLH
ncbi:chaplin [Actinomadura sp. NAK00032]|uniref:chaplin family protein n=1 Tax=Actinomadura sp. NAK00032 TaxID=2742128 RepID=UPI00159237DD|nr:chaplin family protein [Actinomadura sp. NAK00032]QKW33242.1 chaplin [Actinomadura sp. NAK00032]